MRISCESDSCFTTLANRGGTFHCNVNWIHFTLECTQLCVAELLNTEDRPAEPLYLQPGIFIIFSVYSNVTEECWQVKEMVRERWGLKCWTRRCLEWPQFLQSESLIATEVTLLLVFLWGRWTMHLTKGIGLFLHPWEPGQLKTK